MADKTQVLKDGYEAFARGEIEAATQNFADDIRWEGPNTDRIPGSGTYTGRDEIVKNAWSVIPETWDNFSVTPDEFIESGDTVIVLGHNEATAKSTGKSVKVPYVHVWRFEGDKLARVQTLSDTAVIAEALES
jgi:ketosteroid isomerase-like protein